jgi:hypothetical protein
LRRAMQPALSCSACIRSPVAGLKYSTLSDTHFCSNWSL